MATKFENKEFEKKKSILELQFQKFLQYQIIAIGVITTFLIAIILALITKQLNVKEFIDWYFIGILSAAFIVLPIMLIDEYKFHVKNILEEIKKL